MSYPDGYKDVSDMLQAGLVRELENCWWRAKTYMPSDIVGATELKDSWVSRPAVQSIPYPWICLNQKTHGFRLGELVTITSGTGMGKSSVIRELEHHLLTTTQDKVGIIHLEETTERTIDGLVGIELSTPYHLDEIRQNYPLHQANDAFDKLFKRDDGEEALSLYDGKELSVEKIVSRIRLMAKAQNIKWIILDHLNLVMSGDYRGDERRSIDALMTQLREVVVETNIGLFVISHLSRQQGVTHEEGGEISLTHLRGSQGIAQLSNIVIALERNQQHEDDWMRNVTKLRILKNRYTGETGETGHLHYDNETGRITEVVVDLEELLS
jgi:twinkle protein